MADDDVLPESIPLALATLEDIFLELDGRDGSGGFLFCFRTYQGHYRTIANGLSVAERGRILAVLQKAHNLDRRSAGGDFAGYVGPTGFEGQSWRHLHAPLWARIPQPIRTLIWFFLSFFTVAAMLRLFH